jgi:hypothetical protein
MELQVTLVELLKRVWRVAPSFAVLSFMACLTAYAVGVPLDKVAITAAVPLVAIFALIKLAGIAVPVSSPSEPRIRISRGIWMLAGAVMLLTALTAIWLFSAGLFGMLRLPENASVALHVAEFCAIGASATLLLIVFIAMRAVISDFSDVLIGELSELLALPARLADSLLPHLRRSRGHCQ